MAGNTIIYFCLNRFFYRDLFIAPLFLGKIESCLANSIYLQVQGREGFVIVRSISLVRCYPVVCRDF